MLLLKHKELVKLLSHLVINLIFFRPSKFINAKRINIEAKIFSNSLRHTCSKKTKLLKSFFHFTKSIIVKTAAKKKPKLQNLSAFNKLWQKFYLNHLFKSFFPFLNNFKKRLTAGAFIAKARGLQTKLVGTSLMKLPGAENSIISCLKVLWPGARPAFCKTLLTLGICRLNGVTIYNPLVNIFKYDLLSFNLPPQLWLILSLLNLRSSNDQKKNLLLFLGKL